MELFARKCDVTGKGMNEGWVVGDGEMYFANEVDAIKWCTDNGYASMDEAYEDDAIYYTAWEDDEYKDWADNGSGDLVQVVEGEFNGFASIGTMEWYWDEEVRSCTGQFEVSGNHFVHDMGEYVVIAK